MMSTQLAAPTSPSEQRYATKRSRNSRREVTKNHYASSDADFEESDGTFINGMKLPHTMDQRGEEAASTDQNNAHLLMSVVENVVNKPSSNQEKSRQRGVTQLSISVRKSARDLKNI